MFKRMISILAGVACLAQAATFAQAGEVRRFADRCAAGSCAWHLAEVKAPQGWMIDQQFSLNTRALMLLPKKEKLSASDPLISVRTQGNGALADPAGRTGATYERLADIMQANGKGSWQVFRVFDPSHAGEEHELLALGKVETGNGRFTVSLVLNADSRATVEKNEDAFRQVLAQIDLLGAQSARPVQVALNH